MTTRRLRVLVVEDSLTVRRRICDALASDRDLEIVGEADNGQRAIELCQSLRPDVMTLDMCLPIMSGLSATEYIMAHCPTPILIVSASTNRGELFKTYDALAAGAVDVLEKPRGDASDDEWDRKLVSAVRLVAKIKVITHPRARLALGRGTQSVAPPVRDATTPSTRVSSRTGKPNAERRPERETALARGIFLSRARSGIQIGSPEAQIRPGSPSPRR